MAIKYRKIIRSGADIRKAVQIQMGPDAISDTSRWDDDQARWALNQAIEFLGNKLRFPLIYTVDIATDNKDFVLPGYIEGPLDVQKQAFSRYAGEGDAESGYWHDVVGHEVTWREDGKLHLELPFYASGDYLRIVYWPTNPPYPTEEVKLVADFAPGDTGIVLDVMLDSLGQNGYVNMNGEIVQYQGTEQGATTTLLNPLRSVNGMPPINHTAGTVVDWCVTSHDASAFQIMQWWSMGVLHGMYLNRASEQERALHDMQQRLYIQLAKEHLRDSYQPARSPRLRMDRVATGLAGLNTWDNRNAY